MGETCPATGAIQFTHQIAFIYRPSFVSFLGACEAFRDAFFAHMNELGIKAGRVKLDDLVRVIVLQMNDFMVPYESVRRRLVETSVMQHEAADYLLSKKDEILKLVAFFTEDRNTYLGKGTDVKTVTGIRTLIENAENNENVDKYLLMKIILIPLHL